MNKAEANLRQGRKVKKGNLSLRYKQYPKYKDSGIKYLGIVPLHWDISNIRRITKEHKQGYYSNKEYTSTGYQLIRITDINDKSNIDYSQCPLVELSLKEFSEFCLKKNDFVFARSGTIGRFGIFTGNIDVIFASYLIRFRFREDIATDFLKYYFLSLNFQDALNSDLHGGANKNIHAENIKNQFAPIPPNLEEQKALAKYLDHKTAQIDTLISKKSKLIDLLKEERAATINQAVTKGLNPDVPMKDSGIEWLGEIPEHWEVKRLKWIIKSKLKYGANESAEVDDLKLPRYIRITDFGEDGKLRADTFKSLPFEKAKDYLLEDGDILFARSGATVGKTFQFKNYQGVACYAGYLIKATPLGICIKSDYLYLFTKSNAYENWKNSIFIQATIQNIGADKYQILDVPVPLLKEQKKIISYINTETTKIDQTISEIKNEIELLQEYRTALISEVVTGKIDVRNEVLK